MNTGCVDHVQADCLWHVVPAEQAAEMMRTMPASAIADMSREAGMPIDSAAVAEMQKNMAAMSPQHLEMMMKLSAGQANNPAAVAEVSLLARFQSVSSSRPLQAQHVN